MSALTAPLGIKHVHARRVVTVATLVHILPYLSASRWSNMAEQDPLLHFRAALAASTPPTLLTAAAESASTLSQATYVSFPAPSSAPEGTEPTKLAKDTSTRYTSKPDSKDEFYTLGQIWLCWSERETGVREYLMKGQQEGMGYVGIADRRGVVEYLQGESEGQGRVVPLGYQPGELRSLFLLRGFG